MHTTTLDHHPLAHLVPHHTFAPCPVTTQDGPEEWRLAVMASDAVGFFAPALWALLSKPNTRPRPVLDNDTSLLNVHLAGYTLHLHQDGYLLVERCNGVFLPVPLVLVRKGKSSTVAMHTSARDLYQALDHNWLAHALSTIDQQLEGTTFCAPAPNRSLVHGRCGGQKDCGTQPTGPLCSIRPSALSRP